MTLDRIISLWKPTILVSDTGQRVESFVGQGNYHAAFNPKSGYESEEDRLFRAEEIDLFVIRQMDGVDTTWQLEYLGMRYEIIRVTEGLAKGTTPRGRYMALTARFRDNE
jgi:hypothetical protein